MPASTPNEFKDGSDSDRIEAAIAGALRSGANSIEIPRWNQKAARAEWLIDRAIVLPSDFTLVLRDCLIRLAPGTRDNLITNAGARTEPPTANRNIRIIGFGNSVLSGGLEAHFDPPGDRSGYRTIGLLLYQTEHFTIEGVRMEETQAWAISLENGCAFGRISNIDFHNTNKYPNQDGIDLRKGCHDILIENITGITGDDTIALTGLLHEPAPGHPNMQIVAGPTKNDDIYNIVINNIKTTTGLHHIVRLLNHDGIRIYNIFINDVMDASVTGGKRDRAAIKIGDLNYSSVSVNQLGDTSRIFVDNVVSRATHVVMIESSLCDSTFRNIVGYDGNTSPVFYGTAPTRNVKVESHSF